MNTNNSEIALFTPIGNFDELYFTKGQKYQGRKINDLLWEVICDKGHKRIIMPDCPSPHLIQRTDGQDQKFFDSSHKVTGKFVFVKTEEKA